MATQQTAHYLTASEIELLRRVLDREKKALANSPSRPPTERSWDEGEDHQAPEVYVAVASGEIPALSSQTTGTGVGTAESIVVPGEGLAVLEKITPDETPQLVSIEAEKVFYNIQEAAIPSGTRFAGIRTKQGRWLAVTGGTAVARPVTRFILRSDLYAAPQANWAIAEKFIWRDTLQDCYVVGTGSGTGTATPIDSTLHTICFGYPKRIFYIVFDWLGEFEGDANLHAGESERRPDTPTREQLCIPPVDQEMIQDLAGGEYEWNDSPEEITRMCCANFVFAPGQQTDPCAGFVGTGS